MKKKMSSYVAFLAMLKISHCVKPNFNIVVVLLYDDEINCLSTFYEPLNGTV